MRSDILLEVNSSIFNNNAAFNQRICDLEKLNSELRDDKKFLENQLKELTNILDVLVCYINRRQNHCCVKEQNSLHGEKQIKTVNEDHISSDELESEPIISDFCNTSLFIAANINKEKIIDQLKDVRYAHKEKYEQYKKQRSNDNESNCTKNNLNEQLKSFRQQHDVIY